MGTCFVCGKIVKDSDEYEWFGYDGDRIHKKRKPKELVKYVVDCVLTARECGEKGSYPWKCGD